MFRTSLCLSSDSPSPYLHTKEAGDAGSWVPTVDLTDNKARVQHTRGLLLCEILAGESLQQIFYHV